jgi:hypothetical protein
MRCECCNDFIRPHETAHGLKYGSVDGEYDVFLPARDSACTVLCSSCGEMLFRLIYSKLNTVTSSVRTTYQR